MSAQALAPGLLEMLAGFPAWLRQETSGWDEGCWRLREHSPQGEGRSPIEVLGHLVDVDEVNAGRLASLFDGGDQRFALFLQETLVDTEAYLGADPAELLDRFAAGRRRLEDTWRSLRPDAWERSGEHETRGRLGAAGLARLLAVHDLEHSSTFAVHR